MHASTLYYPKRDSGNNVLRGRNGFENAATKIKGKQLKILVSLTVLAWILAKISVQYPLPTWALHLK